MSDIKTVCLGTSNSLEYPQGGHLWVFLNWAAGFRAHGCRILWLDVTEATDTAESLQHKIAILKSRIAPYGLADSIVLVQPDGTPLHHRTDCLSLDEAFSADFLFDLRYDFPESFVKQFRRTALLDIDPDTCCAEPTSTAGERNREVRRAPSAERRKKDLLRQKVPYVVQV